MEHTKRIKKLESLILKHKRLYYSGKPEIDDEKYDQLELELRSLNSESYVLQMVGSDIFNSEKIEHHYKMLSLRKTYSQNELIDWINNKDCISVFKIDGMSCSLIYENGKLVLAKTRGDGQFGENILDKTSLIPTIPKKIKDNKKIEIRGEIFCKKSIFNELKNEMIALGLDEPTSLRNIVAGIIGRKDHIDLSRFLTFYAFDITDISQTQKKDICSTEKEKLDLLSSFNFLIPKYTLHKSSEMIEKVITETSEFMNNGDYLIDGLVFILNDLSVHAEMGETSHHPRYKIAFKFQSEKKVAIIKEILWQTSRNRILTPVAIIEPTELSGAVIQKVTLHNYGVVNEHRLKAGDEISIIRSGEVIPKFLEKVKSCDIGKFVIPTECKSCGSPVEIEDIRIVCKNVECTAAKREEILNFVKKIGIEDLSGKRIEVFMNKGLVTKIEDLYTITVDQLLKLDKVKDKLATKIIKNINDSKNTDIITFMSALGINGGAYNKCEKIYNNGITTLEQWLNLNIESLMKIESFAEKSSQIFIESLSSKKNLIKNLISIGFSFEEKKQNESILNNLSFCITGNLSMKRSEIEKIIKDNGGKCLGSVSKNLDYLVCNADSSSSSKFKKASTLGIKIIDEKKLFSLIKNQQL